MVAGYQEIHKDFGALTDRKLRLLCPKSTPKEQFCSTGSLPVHRLKNGTRMEEDALRSRSDSAGPDGIYTRELTLPERALGITINEKKIRRIMDVYGLRALIYTGFKVRTTDSEHGYGYAPNLLLGKTITGLNQVWVADITYIRILAGFVYLAAILDLFSRRVVGWALSKSMHHSICLEALRMAISARNPPQGCIHHSDRGVQYACPGYRQFAESQGLVISMSGKGYCYDNAFMESWFKTLKSEEVYLTEYETYADVIASIPNFIEAVYNSKRLHSSIGYLSPNEFENLTVKGVLKERGIQPVIYLPDKTWD